MLITQIIQSRFAETSRQAHRVKTNCRQAENLQKATDDLFFYIIKHSVTSRCSKLLFVHIRKLINKEGGAVEVSDWSKRKLDHPQSWRGTFGELSRQVWTSQLCEIGRERESDRVKKEGVDSHSANICVCCQSALQQDADFLLITGAPILSNSTCLHM